MHSSDEVAREVRIAGTQLRCQVCDYPRFLEREMRLETTATGFGIDWAHRKATCFVCESCGFVHWFQPSAARGPTLAEDLEGLGMIQEDLDALRAR